MRRLLVVALLTGLGLSTGCKEEKSIAPKEVPPAPKGPPMGGKAGGGASDKAGAGGVAP